MNSVSEEDIRRMVLPISFRAMREAPHRDGPPLAPGEVRERMVCVRVLHLDLVGVAFDECHNVPVGLVVHFRHVT